MDPIPSPSGVSKPCIQWNNAVSEYYIALALLIHTILSILVFYIVLVQPTPLTTDNTVKKICIMYVFCVHVDVHSEQGAIAVWAGGHCEQTGEYGWRGTASWRYASWGNERTQWNRRCCSVIGFGATWMHITISLGLCLTAYTYFI